MAENVRAHAVIRGRVQGVYFRMETRNAAKRIGVTGWVKNKPDGNVEAVFEGEKKLVERMIEWCGQGPPAARVDEVEIKWEDYTGEFGDFNVTY